MEQQTYEREIDLIQLIKAMLKKFWIMVAAGVVGSNGEELKQPRST